MFTIRGESMAHEISLGRQLPHGLTDLFFEQAAAKAALERIIQETFDHWSYKRIVLPTFEYYETLVTGASLQLKEEMYRFFDRDGQVLALRPDMTVPTARVVGTKLYDQMLPLRFYYIGNVFRYDEPQAGRRREFTQAGVELIGAGTPEADAEVLALAVAVLRAMNLANFQINLGQVSFLKAILNDIPLANGDLARLEQTIDRKNDIELQSTLDDLNIPEAAARAIRAIPHLQGDEGVLREAERLSTNASARQAIENLECIYQLLQAAGVAEHIILDLGEMRSMAYYTGITFHGYVAGLGFSICSGGRYDGLVGNFGAEMPAVGFALGVERSMLVTKPQVDLAPDLVMQTCMHPECHALAALARGRGLRVEVDVLGRREEALVAYARARGAHHAVYCRDAATYVLSDAQSSRVVSQRELTEEITAWNQ
jgi:ATP phosphoribosyltransferase regulatory subunit